MENCDCVDGSAGRLRFIGRSPGSSIPSHLELVPMPLGKVLYASGDTLRYVYFPTNAIVSLLYVMESGA